MEKIEAETALFAEADCLTVTGSDETLAAVRARLPSRARFVGYGERVSFSYVTREVLRSDGHRCRVPWRAWPTTWLHW